MCGICGIINFDNKPVPEPELRKMNNLAQHRGPDGEGYFIKDNLGLGHRRLAIIDLTEMGAQPFHYKTPKDKKLIIVHNGEIYNYLALKNELINIGYKFRSNTDTEVIVAAYDYWGVDCVKKFNGMWAFTIYDEVNNILFCSRDRYGIKPFYYTKAHNQFCFASEIKQFTGLSFWQPRLNKTRAWEFLNFGWHDHTAETLFENVFQLPPGTSLELDLLDGKIILQNYYIPGKNNIAIENFDSTTVERQFIDSLSDAVQSHLRSDVPVGTSLSGGLDSSSVIACIQQRNGQQMQEVVSAVFPGYERNEQPFVDAVAEKFNLNVFITSPSFYQLTEHLDHLIWHQDEPISSASIFAQYGVYRTAAENELKVMLDGQGADEILAGYEKFYMPYFKAVFPKQPIAGISILMNTLKHQDLFRNKVKTHLAKKIAPWSKENHITVNSFRPQTSALFKRTDDTSIRQCSINLLQEIGLPMLLRYQDRNSMAFSVESRVPYLDYWLVEFCLALPDNWKINNGVNKFILRKSMENKLPKEILARKDKCAFEVPEICWIKKHSKWFRKQMETAVNQFSDILAPDSLSQFDSFLKGNKEDFEFIWRIIIFSRWAQLFNVKTEC